MKVLEPNSAKGAMARSPRRHSTQTKAAISIMPARPATTGAIVQPPGPEPRVRPQARPLREAVASTAPARSSGVLSALDSTGTDIQARTTAATASGRFNRNIDGQPMVSISQPPSTGPIAAAMAPAAAQRPMARPRASPEKAPPRMARLLGSRIAAPIPCTPRPSRSQPMEGAKAHVADARANRVTPLTSNRRRPYRSPRAPPRRSKALSGRR